MRRDWRVSELSPWHMGSITGEKSSAGSPCSWPHPHSRRGGGCKQRLFQSAPAAVTHCFCLLQTVLGRCPGGQHNGRALGAGAEEGPGWIIKHNARAGLGRLYHLSSSQETKSFFSRCSQITLPSKAFKSWKETDLASALYLFIYFGQGRGGEWGSYKAVHSLGVTYKGAGTEWLPWCLRDPLAVDPDGNPLHLCARSPSVCAEKTRRHRAWGNLGMHVPMGKAGEWLQMPSDGLKEKLGPIIQLSGQQETRENIENLPEAIVLAISACQLHSGVARFSCNVAQLWRTWQVWLAPWNTAQRCASTHQPS